MVKVKICGITNIEDAMAAADSGADAIGFMFYEKSPRYITPSRAAEIIKKLPPVITTVGVFVDMPGREVLEIMRGAGLDVAQFHGSEPPEDCAIAKRAIKAIRIRELSDLNAMRHYKVSAFLLDAWSPDAPGGTGQIFNWSVALDAKPLGRIILAGGLTPENVAEAVRMVRPYAVDVSTGVESGKGIKDHSKMREFIHRAKTSITPAGI
ncbi:MAG: phosphoribosylanthranilate isomerase [Actinomycetota bacterium]|nr:phosphoribosylanthranilate isomerase [Actinomycetota bacterium]